MYFRGPNGPLNSPQPATPPVDFGNNLFQGRFNFDEESYAKRRCYKFDNRMPLGRPISNSDMELSLPPGPLHQQSYLLLQDGV